MSSIEDKNPSASEAVVDVDVDDNGRVDEKRGNAQDRADMYRMGKLQEMKVHFYSRTRALIATIDTST